MSSYRITVNTNFGVEKKETEGLGDAAECARGART